MSGARAFAVARRVIAQFRRDRRTLGLLIVAPLVVLTLVWALWGLATASHLTVSIGNAAFAQAIAPRLEDAGHSARRVATLDEVVADVREGRADAGIWGGGLPVRIVVEGSDPLRTGTTLSALQGLLVQGVASTGAFTVDYVYGGPEYTLLDYLAPMLVAFFGFFFMFLLATVSFLRERTSGTLERLLATPLRRRELVVGYLMGFGAFALLQAVVILGYTIAVIGVRYRGNPATIFLIEAILVLGAVALGLAISAFARNELQAVQFVPLILLPQVFLSGLLVPVDDLHPVLRAIAAFLPLTYANEALRAVMVKGYGIGDPLVVRDVAIIAAFAVAAVVAAVASIRREVA